MVNEVVLVCQVRAEVDRDVCDGLRDDRKSDGVVLRSNACLDRLRVSQAMGRRE